jgi:hypothetical protein
LQLTILRQETVIFVVTVVCVAACFAQSPSAKAPDLDAELSVMLTRDSACESKETATGADRAEPPQTHSAQPLASVQPLKNSSGRNVGIIATVEGACHCSRGNCATYVYLKAGQTYRLALKENLASLHPLKGFKQSMPALSGKVQVSDSEAETIIYEWSGGEYQPGICATVVQEGGSHPLITKHACAKP